MDIRDRVIELKRIRADALQNHAGNWRRHPNFQRDALRGALKEIGIAGALTVYNSERQGGLTLIDGHLRKGDFPDVEWPVLVLDVNDEEADLLLATLDPMAALAQSDDKQLVTLLEGIQVEDEALREMLKGLDLEAQLGLENELVEALEAQIDKAKELQEKWQVQVGDVWRAGEHFITCGDCRDPETWARLLTVAGVDKVNGVFTSPPYAEQRKKQYGGVPVNEYVDWWEAVQANVRAHLADNGSFFVNIKPHCEKGERVLYVFDLVLAMRRQWGWRFVDELCWYRGGYPGKWPNRFKNEWEPIYHLALSDAVAMNHAAVIKDFAPSSLPDRLTTYDGIDNAPSRGGSPFRQKWKKSAEFDGALPGNVLKIPHSETATNTGAYQAAPFPIALPDFFIRAYSDEGDAWLDPFLGSGTTIVAAHQNNRRGLGIELLEKYVSVTLERLSDMGLQVARTD